MFVLQRHVQCLLPFRTNMEAVEHLFERVDRNIVGAVVVATGAALWLFGPGQKKYKLPPSPYWTLPLVGDIFRKMGLLHNYIVGRITGFLNITYNCCDHVFDIVSSKCYLIFNYEEVLIVL